LSRLERRSRPDTGGRISLFENAETAEFKAQIGGIVDIDFSESQSFACDA
jgi:hypothetical protein